MAFRMEQLTMPDSAAGRIAGDFASRALSPLRGAETRYYTPETHRAAFDLPGYVAELTV